MTIIRRGSRFAVKLHVGGGRYRWLGTFGTLEEAQQAESDGRLKPGRDRPTVEQWSRIWLADYARAAQSTRRVYADAVKAVVAEVGSMRMVDVDRLKARQLAMSWPRNTSAIARTMWNDAIDAMVVAENPWANMRLPQSRGRRDINALTEAEVGELGRLAESAHGTYGPEARAIVFTLAYTTIRPGELFGLSWSDLDIQQQEMTLWQTKVGKSKRIILPQIVVDAVAVVPRTLDGLVFHSRTGRPLNKGTFHYMWRSIAAAWEAAGHAHIDPYELRHAGATMLLRLGVHESDVAVQMGHSDGGGLVRQRYGHKENELARDRLKMAFAAMQSQPVAGPVRKGRKSA